MKVFLRGAAHIYLYCFFVIRIYPIPGNCAAGLYLKFVPFLFELCNVLTHYVCF